MYMLLRAMALQTKVALMQTRLLLARTPNFNPGPKPKRFGDDVDWNPYSHRWERQSEGKSSGVPKASIQDMDKLYDRQYEALYDRVENMNMNLYDSWSEEDAGEFSEEPVQIDVDVTNDLIGLYGNHDYQGALQETLNNTAVYMAITPEALKGVLQEGQFKNALQSGGGTFSKTKETIMNRFYDIESPILGVEPDSVNDDNLSALPKYGFLSGKDGMDYRKIVSWGYGDVFVKFKEDMRDRSSWTLGDSYAGNAHSEDNGILTPPSSLKTANAGIALHPLVDMDDRVYKDELGSATQADNVKKWVENKDYQKLTEVANVPYIEVQMYGGVDLNDIESIEVNSKALASEISSMMEEAQLDVEIRASNFDQRVDGLYGRGGVTASLSEEDIDGLGDNLVDNLVNFSKFRNYYNQALPVSVYPYEIIDSIQEVSVAIKMSPDETEMSELLTRDEEDDYLDVLNERGIEGLEEYVSPAMWRNWVRDIEDIRAERVYDQVVDTDMRRDIMKLYWAEMAKGADSTLPSAYWSKYDASTTGWVKDVMNEKLINEYVAE